MTSLSVPVATSQSSTEEHAACILAIVGSRDVPKVAGHAAIVSALARHQPIMVVSGGAKATGASSLRGLISIDAEAAALARGQGIQVVEFLPKTYHWEGPGGFKERNEKIASTCVCLVRIASSTTTTYGSGWTADLAERLGKNVERFTVNEKGEIISG